jgi:hypothetical protein
MLEADNLDTGEVFTYEFDCEARAGATGPMSEGQYSAHVDLLRCGGDPSCAAPVVLSRAAPVDTPYLAGGDYDLGEFVFER